MLAGGRVLGVTVDEAELFLDADGGKRVAREKDRCRNDPHCLYFKGADVTYHCGTGFVFNRKDCESFWSAQVDTPTPSSLSGTEDFSRFHILN